jgi:hypothetical protein
MDRRAKVHGELAADAVRRRVRQDNGPDAVILLKSDRRHFSHSSVRSGFRLAIGENGHLLSESGEIDCALKLRIGQHAVPVRERLVSQMMPGDEIISSPGNNAVLARG